MRVLMVSEDLPGEQVGGLGKHVVTLANAMLALGHEVAILGRNDCGTEGCAAQIGFHGRFLPGFDYRRPGWKELQMGVFNPFKRPFFARKIARAINEHAAGFDVVHYHGHLPMVGLYLAPGINYVQTRHDQGSECLTHLRFRDQQVCATLEPADCSACIARDAGPVRRAITAVTVNGYRGQNARAFASQKTVFVSEFLRRQFQRAVPDADLARTRVIHNFIDYRRLASVAAAAPPPGAGEVLLAGRVDAGKGFGEFLARAAGRLPPRAMLRIVGDGPERAALELSYAGERVHFLGWQDYDSVIARAARSHLCVVPSVCEEACSTTVLEALALGRQCVALARGGTPELAAYQAYPGQLQLASTMDELVERVREQLAQPPRRVAPPPRFGADATLTIPRLLDFYAE